MPTIRDQAICIRRWAFSESSQTVSLLVREHGIIRGLAKGARREKGLFSGGIDLLTRGQVVALVKPGRDLATLTQWHLDETFMGLRRDPRANRIGWYLADLLHHLLTDHDPHPTIYDALEATLLGMEDPSSADRRLLAFQWQLLDDLGYRPEVQRDAGTGAPLDADADTLGFSPGAGGVVEDTGTPDRWRVRAATVATLQHQARGDAVDEKTPAETIDRANRLLAAYAREIIGREPPAMAWLFNT